MVLDKKNSLLGLLAVFFIFFFTACQPKEIPIPKPSTGNIQIGAVDMGSTYKWQVYYDLETNTMINKNAKTDWDLGFSSQNYIILNSSKLMFAFRKESSFETVDTLGLSQNKKCDVPSGNTDSLAIYDWQGKSPIFIIDRGFSENGVHQGYKKIQILSVDDLQYNIRVANLNNTQDTSLFIPKTTEYNYTFLNFNSYKIVSIEPPKKQWDLVFTAYTHIFYEPYMPYLVTGCLLNRYDTQAVLCSHTDWQSVDLNFVQNLTLKNDINSIGYDWKTYNLNQGIFTVDSQKIYIIRTSGGYYYKLRFIDFYNNGVKGSPKFEIQRI